MSANTVGRFLATTFSLGASGLDRSQALVGGTGLSTEPFKNLCLTVKPTSSTANYQVDVYFDGELEERHIYPDLADQGTICHMNFPNMIFPPNCGTNVIPNFFQNGRFVIDEIGVSFVVTNLSANKEAFYIYVCFEEFDSCRSGKLPCTIGYTP